MNIHKDAQLTPLHRVEMAVAVLGGALTKAQAARVYAVSATNTSGTPRRVLKRGKAPRKSNHGGCANFRM